MISNRIKNILAIGAIAGAIEGMILNASFKTQTPWEQRILSPGLIYKTDSVRKYTGIPRMFREGIEQKVYVDYKPFGSLDGVETKQWSNSREYLGTLRARASFAGEEDAFLLLHYSRDNVMVQEASERDVIKLD